MTILHRACERIRLVLLDVDGVLTDGRLGILPDGREIKFFSIYDGLAIRLARKSGIEVGFLSGRKSREVDVRARELGVKMVIQGSRDKLADFERLLAERDMEASEVAFMGDDLPDLPLLKRVGLSAAPANAVGQVKCCVHYVTRAAGGAGAVREVLKMILESSGKWETATRDWIAGPGGAAGV
ncbi:MAG: KdsC family phosphatase [Acidobacteriota bacterium]